MGTPEWVSIVRNKVHFVEQVKYFNVMISYKLINGCLRHSVTIQVRSWEKSVVTCIVSNVLSGTKMLLK